MKSQFEIQLNSRQFTPEACWYGSATGMEWNLAVIGADPSRPLAEQPNLTLVNVLGRADALVGGGGFSVSADVELVVDTSFATISARARYGTNGELVTRVGLLITLGGF